MVNRILLVWKYFFRQKYDEMVDNLHLVFIISFVIGYILTMVAFMPEKNIWWVAPIPLAIAGFWILFIVVKLLKVIFSWLGSNWDLANERADADISNSKQRSKK